MTIKAAYAIAGSPVISHHLGLLAASLYEPNDKPEPIWAIRTPAAHPLNPLDKIRVEGFNTYPCDRDLPESLRAKLLYICHAPKIKPLIEDKITRSMLEELRRAFEIGIERFKVLWLQDPPEDRGNITFEAIMVSDWTPEKFVMYFTMNTYQAHANRPDTSFYPAITRKSK